MKIRILGFHWKMYGNTTMPDLRRVLEIESARRLAQLDGLLKTGNSNGWDGTVFTMADKAPYIAGLVLKVRDQKQFCQVSQAAGRMRLTAQALMEGSKMAEINFFLVHPTTGRGLYQYYHHSTWPASFGYLCKKVWDADMVRRFSELGLQAEEYLWSGARLKAEKDRIKGTMTPELIVKPEAFDRLVDELRAIGHVGLSIRDTSVKVSKMGLLQKSARHMNIQFSYGDDVRIDQLKTAVKNVAAAIRPSRMRVEGESQNGHEEIVNLVNNPDAFDEMDFDEATADLDLDLSNPAASLHASGMIRRLMETAASPKLTQMLATP